MRLGLFINTEKDKNMKVTGHILRAAEKNKAGIYRIEADLEEENEINRCDAFLCVGGDGTFLRAARKIYRAGKPILGINKGSLGFLTEVEYNDIDEAIEKVVNHTYKIEERMMIEANVARNGENVFRDEALNDFVITSGRTARTLHLKAYMNQCYVNTYHGDGIVFATPTGSTAYSMSAGGPIVQPDTKLIIMTGICQHSISARPYIAAENSIAKVIVDEDYEKESFLSADGSEKNFELHGGDKIEIKKSENILNVIKLKDTDVFKVLRKKMYEREELLGKNEI